MNFYLDEGVLPPFVKPKPVGQVHWTVPGTYTWICPEEVKEVSVAMVGAGAANEATTTGAGGNLRWINKVPVIPGQSYQIVVGAGNKTNVPNPSSALGYNTSQALGGVVDGGNGSPSRNSQNAYGGDSGKPNKATGTSGYGIDLATMTVNSTTPPGTSRNSARQGLTSGGGAGTWNNNGQIGFQGGPGAVRIIWGDDRAFPFTNILDR